MTRSNISSWFGLTNTILIVCLLAYDVEMEVTKLHMGILENHQDDHIKYDKPLQCSYALAALNQLQLTDKLLYGPDNEFQYVPPNYDFILFDAESVSMLETLHSLPSHDHLRGILMQLWLYTDRVHRLLAAPSKGIKVDSLNTKFMFKAHENIKLALVVFLSFNMGQHCNIQEILKEINIENITDKQDPTALLRTNKSRLNDQIAFNKNYGVSTEGKEQISFETLTNLHKSVEFGSIVVEYFGQNYWDVVKNEMREMYDKAMILDITISYQITILWHINNGIMKILKLIFNRFVKNYLDFSVDPRDSSEDRPDEVIIPKLSEYCECVNRPLEWYDSLSRKPEESFCLLDFYVGIKRDIETEKDYYPLSTNIENISDYYFLLSNETNMTRSKETVEWENIDAFIEKVKTLFSDFNKDVIKFFEISFPIFSTTFQSLEVWK